jgi:Cys-tRNA(Pro) deacylase
MSLATPATRTLDLLGISYQLFEHPQPPESLEQAAHERGQAPEQIVRSIVFRLAEGQFALVLMAGPGQVSWRRIRTHLGVSRLSMASESEVREATGYQVGAVSPLGLPHPIRILADMSVFQAEEISIGSGRRGVAIILKPTDLRRALTQIEIGAFAV